VFHKPPEYFGPGKSHGISPLLIYGNLQPEEIQPFLEIFASEMAFAGPML